MALKAPQDRSVVVALLLMLFFGAFGLFYITRWWVALLLIVLEVFVAVFTLGLGLLILHPVLCVWACIAASRQHTEFQTSIAHIQSPRG